MPSDPPPPPAGWPPPPDGGSAGSTPGPSATDAEFATPRALHPASIVLGIPLRQLVQGVLVPALIGASAGPNLQVATLIVAGVLVATAVVRVLAWRRFRFSFDGEVLRVDEGVLSRNHRALDVARIQQVEVDRSLIARLLGLSTLRVETAGGSGEAEVELRVIPETDAHALRTAVRASKAALHGAPAASGDPGEPTGMGQGTDAGVGDAATSTSTDGSSADDRGRVVVRMSLARVVAAAVSGSRLLVLPAILAASTQFLGEATEFSGGALDPETVARRVLALGVVAIIVLLIPASVVAATTVGVLRDWNWTMRRIDEDLHISRGLLATRESVLPIARVQRVEVQRNWVRRAFGCASIRVHSAGGSGDDRRVTIPLVRDAEVDVLVTALLPGVGGVPALGSHPRAALRRAVFRWVRAALIPAVALLVVPGLVGPLRVLGGALPVIAALLGVIEYGQLAHGRDDQVLAARSGALSVTVGLAPLRKVQGVTRRSSPFQRRLHLATLTAHVAGPGGDLQVLDLGADAARDLHGALVTTAAAAP